MKTFKALLNLLSVALIASTMLMSCSKKSGDGDQASGEKSAEKQTLWVYTSLYKDTINRLKPMLAQDFPNVEFKWFQAGSEDIATKVNAEILSGRVQADVMISSDRFWYEELAQSGYLEKNQDYIL